MPKRVIVFDTETVAFEGNRIFDPSFASRFPGASFLPELKEKAYRNGVDLLTAEEFLSDRFLDAEVAVLSDGFTRYSPILARRGARMGTIFSGESPNIVPWFYHRLEKYTTPFEHAVLFRGFFGRAHSNTKCHHWYWPCPTDRMLGGARFSERRLLVMVASNKTRFPFNPQRPIRSVAGYLYRKAQWHYYQTVDAILRFEDLYEVRLRALEHFGPQADFQLFGKGWERDWQRKTRVGSIRYASRPVPCDDKYSTMAGFKFGLCFENCSFPGYVTEKVFDALLAGCVPVYAGAPDIGEFCPQECFIQYRDFFSFADLEYALRNYTEREWERHRHAARDFLASTAYAPHRPGAFSDQLLQWLVPKR